MAILELAVYVQIRANTLDHYESFGCYNIVKYIHRSGELRVKKNRTLVSIDHLSKGCTTKVTKICDLCDSKTKDVAYNVLVRARKESEGRDLCTECKRETGIKVFTIQDEKLNKNGKIIGRSLKKLVEDEPKYSHLLLEWSDYNKASPAEIAGKSSKSFLWKCPVCKSEYDMKVRDRTVMNCNCPFCGGYRINETNNLESCFPEIAKEYSKKNMTEACLVYKYSTKKVIWECNKCENEWKNTVVSRTKHNSNCPMCSKYITESMGMKIVKEYLETNDKRFEKEYTFDDLKSDKGYKIRYDFGVLDKNNELTHLVEFDGQHHFMAVNYNNNKVNTDAESKERLRRQLNLDKLKDDYAVKNNIPLIRLTYKLKEIEIIEDLEEFLSV